MTEVKTLTPRALRVLDIIGFGTKDPTVLMRGLEDGACLKAWGFTDEDIPAIDEAYEWLEMITE